MMQPRRKRAWGENAAAQLLGARLIHCPLGGDVAEQSKWRVERIEKHGSGYQVWLKLMMRTPNVITMDIRRPHTRCHWDRKTKMLRLGLTELRERWWQIDLLHQSGE